MRFELPPDKRAMTNEQLLGDLRKCEREFAPLPLTKQRYNKVGLFSSAGIQLRFGSWDKAITLAGLRHSKRINVPLEELLEDLRRVANELATTTVTVGEYGSRGKFSPSAVSRRFKGSWNAALIAAGLNISPLGNFNGTDEQYFEVIETAWQRFGRPPKQAEIRRPDWPVGGKSIARRFGSWRAALEAFVNQAEHAPAEGAKTCEDANGSPLPDQERAAVHCTNRNIGWRLRFLVLRRDGFRCRLCGASPAITPGVQLQVDHMEPWANGGETVLENLQSTCDRCNGGKSALPLQETDATDENKPHDRPQDGRLIDAGGDRT